MLTLHRLNYENDMFKALFDDFWGWNGYNTKTNYVSKIENDYLNLSVDVPGVTKDNISFEYDKGYLLLNWTRNDSKNSQSWYVGTKYDFEKSNVKLENGVLHMTVPLKKEFASSKINLLK